MRNAERFQNNYDLLRLLAAFFITFSHSFSLLKSAKSEPLFLLSGGSINFVTLGLGIFFAISGYLIGKSARTSPTLLNYLWKRLLRIQPLLLVTCVLTVFGCVFFTTLSAKAYFLHPATWTYFRNIMPVFGLQYTLPGVFEGNILESGVNGSLWTLVVEERLYLLMCLAFFLRFKHRKIFVAMVIIADLIYLTNGVAYQYELIPYLSNSASYYGFIFLNAAALNYLNIRFAKYLRGSVIISVLLFLAAASSPAFRFLFIFAFPILVNSVAQIKGTANYTGRYGDFTYGVYVFSFPIQQMFIASGYFITSPYLLFLCTILISFPMAVLSWNLIESKCLSLKKAVGMKPVSLPYRNVAKQESL